ncbi:hypothetical protein EDI_204110 [Entamoeba dispar SAW760]|uniref:Uncharacterized protein n=1 Tax=Entamoeba dispar (strain ATCC PRA-260 / SAW760) TaxID=370354 RepID=B0ESJ5_ENTDS|nr:uncharacterized protein EDI_204110 [Entamoeba dispar SAW760]EDR22489.1 hypothetical protein EDI_204110 [Entamoeba dispar SAW760]|eukprot:EDR22489.1 hypothetical protein EDI_204110 [Entamoeba dispar SAW760]
MDFSSPKSTPTENTPLLNTNQKNQEELNVFQPPSKIDTFINSLSQLFNSETTNTSNTTTQEILPTPTQFTKLPEFSKVQNQYKEKKQKYQKRKGSYEALRSN